MQLYWSIVCRHHSADKKRVERTDNQKEQQKEKTTKKNSRKRKQSRETD